MPKTKKGRKRTERNVSKTPVPQTSGGSNRNSTEKRPSSLPRQYEFTPPDHIPLPQSQQAQAQVMPQMSATPHMRDYPPPIMFYQDTPIPYVPMSHLLNSQGQNQQATMSPLQHSQGQSENAPSSSRQNSGAPSHPSSQGNNFDEHVLSDLHPDIARALNALLLVLDRDQFTTVLSPIRKPNTFWFTRDKGAQLVRKITKIFTNKFDGPYYSWTVVPRERQESYFLEFAKTHTWDPLITETVKHHFYTICQRRMKDMVSNARTSRERPPWINETIWKTMTEYWDTEEAQQKSITYSNARLSDLNGVGPHIHLGGPRSYQQIQEEMEEKLGRPVSLSEVFIKTHTKPDGTYVDRKAEKISENYEKNLNERLAQLEGEASSISDGASRLRELTTEEYTAIFLQTTEKDSRGVLYGVRSLKDTVNGLTLNRKQQEQSPAFEAMQQQLKEAQRAVDEEKGKLHQLSLVEEYLRQTDPNFQDFMAAHTPAGTASCAHKDPAPATPPPPS